MGSRNRQLLSAALWLAALTIALPSLAYPLGRDQGVYFYVAREWLNHGSIPYRDLFDHKPPGIYVIYALAIALFRSHVWGIRVMEMAALGGSAWLATRLTKPRDGVAPSAAFVALFGSCLYFGVLNFWDTAQCELWCVTTALAAAYCAQRSGWRWVAASGALFAFTVLIKLPAVFFGLPIFALVWAENAERRARVLTWLVAGAAVVAAFAVYFGAHGALGQATDIIFRANVYYASHEHVDGFSDGVTRVLDVFRLFMPLSLVLVYALGGLPFFNKRAELRADRRRVLLWSAAALVGVVAQLKLYNFHFVLMLAPALLAGALVSRALEVWAVERGSSLGRVRAILGANVLVLFALSWPGEHMWFATARDVALVEVGARPRQEMLAHFTLPYADFDEGANEQVALWIQANSSPLDVVCVRRFEPEIYALSDRSCSSPFFWTYWLTEPSRAYRRGEFLEEDREALERTRPKIMVARREARAGEIDDASYAEGLGYVRRKEIGPYILMVDGSTIAAAR